jgi:hypothetical protein
MSLMVETVYAVHNEYWCHALAEVFGTLFPSYFFPYLNFLSSSFDKNVELQLYDASENIYEVGIFLFSAGSSL